MTIPLDKQAHFFSGMALAAVVSPFGPIASLAAVLIAAVGKEIWDSYGHGTPDKYDAGATLLGGYALLSWLWLAGRYL